MIIPDKIVVKESIESHISTIYEISNSCLRNSWSLNLYKEDFKNIFSKYFSLMYDNKLIGFLSAYVIINEVNITNIAINKNYQGNGFSKYLLSNLIDSYKNFEIFLEVRESNYVAINLYKKFKFMEIHKRINYYNNPVENAIIMKKF